MKTIHLPALLGVCALLPALAFAQPPLPPMGGRLPMGGAMTRSAKGRLPRLILGAARLSGPDALSKKQARRMNSLLSPWTSRPRMSEAQAQSLYSQASAILTANQIRTIEAQRPDGPRGDRPRGGGGGNRPSFGGRRGGPPMGAMRAMMESYNPLYGGASGMESQLPSRMQEGLQRRRDRLNTALEQVRKMAR